VCSTIEQPALEKVFIPSHVPGTVLRHFAATLGDIVDARQRPVGGEGMGLSSRARAPPSVRAHDLPAVTPQGRSAGEEVRILCIGEDAVWLGCSEENSGESRAYFGGGVSEPRHLSSRRYHGVDRVLSRLTG
jgi:hypothetical protein